MGENRGKFYSLNVPLKVSQHPKPCTCATGLMCLSCQPPTVDASCPAVLLCWLLLAFRSYAAPAGLLSTQLCTVHSAHLPELTLQH